MCVRCIDVDVRKNQKIKLVESTNTFLSAYLLPSFFIPYPYFLRPSKSTNLTQHPVQYRYSVYSNFSLFSHFQIPDFAGFLILSGFIQLPVQLYLLYNFEKYSMESVQLVIQSLVIALIVLQLTAGYFTIRRISRVSAERFYIQKLIEKTMVREENNASQVDTIDTESRKKWLICPFTFHLSRMVFFFYEQKIVLFLSWYTNSSTTSFYFQAINYYKLNSR